MKLNNYFEQILYILGKKKKIFSILIILFLILSFFETLSLAIIVPFLSIVLIENEQDRDDSIFYEIVEKLQFHENIIVSFAILTILIFISKLIVSILNIYITNSIAWKEIIRLRLKLLLSFNSMSYEEYIKRNSAYYINQISILSSYFVKQTFFPLIKIVSDVIIIICIITFLGFLNIIILSSVVTTLLLLLITYDSFFKKKMTRYGYEIDSSQRNILKNINEMFYGFKEIKILNKLSFFIEKIVISTKKLANRQVKTRLIADSPRFIYEFIIAVLVVFFVVSYIIFFQMEIILIIPTISVFILAFLRLLPMVSSINQNLTLVRTGIVANETVYNQLKLTEKIHSDKEKIFKDDNLKFESLKLEKISFGYEKNEIILDSINLDFNAGEMIGIVGGSGSGKTTLIDILLGLLKPKNGLIYLNGKIMNFNDYQNNISKISYYLPQSNFIFEDNVIKNISLTEKIDSNNLKKTKDILKKLNLDLNIDKNLGDRGSNLSGGQRQRVSIARSFFSNRQILIMDESTNALDEENEKDILDYLNTLKKDISIVLISHNIEMLKNCDRIYKIENKHLKKIK